MATLLATAKSGLLIVAAVELVKLLAVRGVVERSLARKLMHIGVGPIFLLTWHFFPADAAVYAAFVPLTMTLKFALTGLGVLRGASADAEVRSMSRSGRKEELLRGPLLYGLTFVGFTYFAFREVVAAASLMNLCLGDGLAELVGVRYGHTGRLPWARRKSWAGSLAFVVGAFGGSLAFAERFHAWGWSASPASALAMPLGLASLAGAAVESLPMADVDNVLVPLAVALVMQLAAP